MQGAQNRVWYTLSTTCASCCYFFRLHRYYVLALTISGSDPDLRSDVQVIGTEKSKRLNVNEDRSERV